MRQTISIPLIILILFTGITVNLAAHYCGGMHVASKISFSGSPATCGMEHPTPEKPGFSESDNCCQDFTSAYTLSGNYIPSSIKIIDNHQVHQITGLVFNTILNQELHSLIAGFINRPPGNDSPNHVDLELICIFRI